MTYRDKYQPYIHLRFSELLVWKNLSVHLLYRGNVTVEDPESSPTRFLRGLQMVLISLVMVHIATADS